MSEGVKSFGNQSDSCWDISVKIRCFLLYLCWSFAVPKSYSHRPDSNVSWPEPWLWKWTTCSRLRARTLSLLHYSTYKIKVHRYQFNTTSTVCLSAHNWVIFPALIWLMTSTVWEIRGVFQVIAGRDQPPSIDLFISPTVLLNSLAPSPLSYSLCTHLPLSHLLLSLFYSSCHCLTF